MQAQTIIRLYIMYFTFMGIGISTGVNQGNKIIIKYLMEYMKFSITYYVYVIYYMFSAANKALVLYQKPSFKIL